MNKNARFERDYQIERLNAEMLAQWVLIEHERKRIVDLFEEMGYKKIGIYGMGYVGKVLEKILMDEEADISYVIDQQYYKMGDGYHLSLNDELDGTDVIIVTLPFFFETVSRDIRETGYKGDIRLLDEFLYQL